MSLELIDVDPITGMQTLLEFDEVNPRKFHIHHRQDVQPLLERNKILQNDPDYKREGIKAGMQHLASVPDIWVHYLKRRKNIDVFNKNDLPKIKQLLRDPAYKFLRATLGDI